MAYPRQFTPGANDPKAVAPYNFVPLPDRVYCPVDFEEADHARYMSGRHSGTIEVSLRTESWLYTRAAVTPEYAREHDNLQKDAIENPTSAYREFFHHGDDQLRPVVPGSSVRGMLRQLIEVMSDSNLTTAPGAGLVYRAVGDSRTRVGLDYRKRFVGPNLTNMQYPVPDVRGGYLFRSGRTWYIQPAGGQICHHGESFVRYQGTPPAGMVAPSEYDVWVLPAPRTPHPHHRGGFTFQLTDPRTTTPPVPRCAPCPSGFVPATLVVTEDVGGNKHMHIAIFEPDRVAPRLEVSETARRQFEADADIQRETLHPGRWPRAGGRLAVPEWNGAGPFNGWACFYMIDAATGALVYFGGTLFFRLPYRNPPARLSPIQGTDDFASRLFGRVGSAAEVRRGRLRVADFQWDGQGGSPFVRDHGGYVSPTALLAPKPACIQHYLVQPSGDLRLLRHYDDAAPDPANPGAPDRTLLRGFKHYWHRHGQLGPEVAQNKSQAPDDPEVVEHRSIRTIVRPVRHGVTFRGRIDFDNLTPQELGALLLAIELPPSKRHKLGMARKLGYGSVKLEVIGLSLVDPAQRYGGFFDSTGTDLAAGFKEADATSGVRNEAVRSFACALAKHRGTLPAAATTEAALDAFWAAPRMKELAALLDWDTAPDPQQTREVPVRVQDDPQAVQWRGRYLLPPPHVVYCPNGPNIWQGVPDPAPVAPESTPPPANPVVLSTAVLPTPTPPRASVSTRRLSWPGATLYWNAGGGGVLTVKWKGAAAEARGSQATQLKSSLTQEAQQRLKKKREIKVNAELEEDGKFRRIIAVQPAP